MEELQEIFDKYQFKLIYTSGINNFFNLKNVEL